MLKRIIHFVQYHNFFSIAVMVVFMGTSVSLAASPELRQGVLSPKEIVRSVDNTYVVNTDFDAHDIGLKIESVAEDAERYYVDYTYNMIAVKDYVWQPIPVADSMKISKKELAWRDLGLYVAEQLGQVIDQHISYLKEVQEKEKKGGATQKVVATEYSGLIGQFLNTREKVFEGYKPVKLPPERPEQLSGSNSGNVAGVGTVSSGGVSSVSAGAPSEPVLTREEVQRIIQETVKRLLAGESVPSADTATSVSSSPPTPDTTTTTTTTTATADATIPPPDSETTTATSTPPANTATTTPPADTSTSTLPIDVGTTTQPSDTENPPADTGTIESAADAEIPPTNTSTTTTTEPTI